MKKNKKNLARLTAKRNESEAFLRSLVFVNRENLFEKFETHKEGLSHEEAAEKLEKIGPNVIETGKSKGPFSRLLESLINPFNIVLLLIAVITFVTDVILSKHKDYTTVTIILSLIVLSSAISFIQSERSNAAASKLSKMISNKVDAFRGGSCISIPIDTVVPGDIIKLSAGDIIPGDVRFLTAKDAFVSQSALTGESNPVEKFCVCKNEPDASLPDFSNLGFMGSNMVSGSATALVLATGNDTYFGSMAQTLNGDRSKNSFERGVDSVSSLLIRIMLIMVPVIFVINGFTKNDWANSLLFAVTIAVGLTPEMLPMIMTSTLAKGAVSMSKHKTIVKTLSSIQTFGEMDVLCTDKTGTLTEDKIVLEKYMDLLGNDNTRILRHAYLNSYFQTGLKNLIDLAVINRANDNELSYLQQQYTLIDEIPFDFSRRRMSVVLKDQYGKRQLITKGAVEEVISICSYAEYNDEILPLDDSVKARAMQVYEKHNREGLRMIAVAQKNDLKKDAETFGVADEKDMVLLGFIGFLDPPKESSKTAITALKKHGVRVVVLTGDSEGVAVKVCKKVGVDVSHCLTGKDVAKMNENELRQAVKTCSLFSKLSPSQKQQVVQAFQKNGHTVGYMGDGINDAPPLHQADVGISVDTAVDIAKETADIILLKKDLMVLEQGVIEGRKTFGNIIKYIKMATSGNFGNMISVMVSSIFLPFLPMLPVHILTQNLLCDFSQMGIPFDNVDSSYLLSPRKWETKSIKRFMIIMGPLSSFFDITLYSIMWWGMKANTLPKAPLFQCGCFLFGTLSQILVVHMIRTARLPFLQSRASLPLLLSTGIVSAIALLIGFTPISHGIDLATLPVTFVPWLILLCASYCVATQLIKKMYIHRWGEWL